MWKKILIGLLGLIALLVLVGFLLPGKMEISRSVVVNAPPEYSFEEVNTLPNWEKWSYWNTQDPNMKVTYGETNQGPGSSYSWTSEPMGNGKLTLTESIPFNSIKAQLVFSEKDTAQSWYMFEPEGENTKVSMGISSEFGMNPINRWFGFLMMESMMNEAFDYSLQKIKERAEAKPKFTVNIGEESVAPMSYVSLSYSMSPKDMQAVSNQMGKMYGELEGVLKKSKVEMSGYPFCIYPKFTEESMDMICAIPVPGEARLPSKYKVSLAPGGRAVKATHIGAYEKLEATHNELNNYITFKNLQISGAPWEVYVTDPYVEKDTAKWITEIYYPVAGN
jgi:effector-binding domain-containing protein